jgi:Superinfection immunity protein/Protein of unknown function (DUF2510)
MIMVALPAWLAAVVVLLAFVLAVGIYFLPFVIGEIRGVPHVGSIFVINLFFGWSVIGWVVALAMACRTKAPPVVPTLSNDTGRGPKPGWYPDSATGDSRWWDGEHWGPTSPVRPQI